MDQAIAPGAGRLDDVVPENKAGEHLPPLTAGSPSAEKKHQYAGREWTSDHPLNLRMSIPLVFGRYYITIVAGKERRARARLAMDRRQHPLDTPSNVAFLFLIGLVAAAGSVTLGYICLAHLFGWSGGLVL